MSGVIFTTLIGLVRLLCAVKHKILVFMMLLVGCSGGGTDPESERSDLSLETTPDGSVLEDLLTASSPTQSKDFYLLPESDDFSNIPQDPLNPLTQAKVDAGKLIFHDPAFATEGVALRAKTWSCATCHHARAGFKSGLIQGMGEGGEGFGLKEKPASGMIPRPALKTQMPACHFTNGLKCRIPGCDAVEVLLAMPQTE